jgi:hypothetical protein
LGYSAGNAFTSAGKNIVIGNYAAYLNTYSNNVYIGHQAGYNSTAADNVFIGHQAGYNATTGTGNVFIGHQAGYDTMGSALSASNCLYIANKPDLYPLIFGSFLTGRIGLQTVEPQYTLDVHGDIRISDMYRLYFGGMDTMEASAFFAFDGDEFIMSNTANVSGGLYVGGDNGAKPGFIGITNVSNPSVSSGTGTVKLCGGTSRNTTGFIKVYVDGDTRYVPYFTDITG